MSSCWPPAPFTPVSWYRQPPPQRRRPLVIALTALFYVLAGVLLLAGGAVGGGYLFLSREIANVQPHSLALKAAAKRLDPPVAHRPAIALLIGSDHRASDPKGSSSRSDTLILIRADPATNTISLLSLPRDLVVNRICPGRPVVRDRINAAFASCGPAGALETVKALTGLPINYLVNVNFHGVKRIVDSVGGIWLDVDRRYYNKNVGTAGTDYADIDLHPGYQELDGEQALAFVRYRHTDSDIYRTARQQLFLAALRQQVRRSFSPLALPGLIDALTKSVEIGGAGGRGISERTLLSYALFAYRLPPAHLVHVQITGLQPSGFENAELIAAQSAIVAAVQQFIRPDVSPAAETGQPRSRPVLKPPRHSKTTVLVLAGNRVPGAAAKLDRLLSQRAYRIILPPTGAAANAPTFGYAKSELLFDPTRPRAHAAAEALADLLGGARVAPLSGSIPNYGAMVTVIAGRSFRGALAAEATLSTQTAAVALEPQVALPFVRQAQRSLPFRAEVPTLIEQHSVPDPAEPARVYTIGGRHRALRLVFHDGFTYWGIEETNWLHAPLPSGGIERRIQGRTFRLYYAGSHLHMVVLERPRASYWVLNSLLDSLPNRTMLAIGKGLRPLQ